MWCGGQLEISESSRLTDTAARTAPLLLPRGSVRPPTCLPAGRCLHAQSLPLTLAVFAVDGSIVSWSGWLGGLVARWLGRAHKSRGMVGMYDDNASSRDPATFMTQQPFLDIRLTPQDPSARLYKSMAFEGRGCIDVVIFID